MAESESSSKKLTIAVVGPLIVSAITWIVAIFSTTFRAWVLGVLRWIKGFLLAVWHFLADAQGVQGWLIVAVVVVGALLVRSWLINRPRTRRLSWEDYKRDTFEGVVWCWSYFGGQISGEPIPRCPTCQQVLVYRQETVLTGGGYGHEFGDVTVYRCEHCGGDKARCDGTVYNVRDRVIRSIDRKLHSGEWQQVMARQKGFTS